MSATATGYLASKPRYEILDGLRGVAAMIVVAFHLLENLLQRPCLTRCSTAAIWPSTSSSCSRAS